MPSTPGRTSSTSEIACIIAVAARSIACTVLRGCGHAAGSPDTCIADRPRARGAHRSPHTDHRASQPAPRTAMYSEPIVSTLYAPTDATALSRISTTTAAATHRTVPRTDPTRAPILRERALTRKGRERNSRRALRPAKQIQHARSRGGAINQSFDQKHTIRGARARPSRTLRTPPRTIHDINQAAATHNLLCMSAPVAEKEDTMTSANSTCARVHHTRRTRRPGPRAPSRHSQRTSGAGSSGGRQ